MKRLKKLDDEVERWKEEAEWWTRFIESCLKSSNWVSQIEISKSENLVTNLVTKT